MVWRSAAARGDWSDAGSDRRQHHTHQEGGGGGEGNAREHRSPRGGPGEYRGTRTHGNATSGQHGGGGTGGGAAWKSHRYDKDGGKTGGEGATGRDSKFQAVSQATPVPNWSKAAASATAHVADSGWHRAGDAKNAASETETRRWKGAGTK